MDESIISLLLEDLKNPNETVRSRATNELWRIWFQQKGMYGLELLERSQILLEVGEFARAEAVLTELIQDQPDFAEAWNRRAILYYLQKEYQKSMRDCQKVLDLNPIHFGALHGLGLCHAALEEYGEAIQTFRKALAIQPHSLENQKMILECTAQMS